MQANVYQVRCLTSTGGEGLGFRVSGLGGLGFGFWVLGFGVQGFVFLGLGFKAVSATAVRAACKGALAHAQRV